MWLLEKMFTVRFLLIGTFFRLGDIVPSLLYLADHLKMVVDPVFHVIIVGPV